MVGDARGFGIDCEHMSDTRAAQAPVTISAIIPTYNRAHVILRSLKSVLAQTTLASEVVVVDDGSTDNTREILAPYLDRITYIRQENAGVSAARNRGAREAGGEWLAFLDSDDEWLPGKIERQLQELKANPHAILVYGGARIRQPDGSESEGRGTPVSELGTALRNGTAIPPSVAVVRRDVFLRVGGFDESLSFGEDWDLWLRLKEHGEFLGVAEPLMLSHRTGDSLSNQVERMLDSGERLIEKTLLRGMTGREKRARARRLRASLYFSASISARTLSLRQERALLWRSILQFPRPALSPDRYKALCRNLLESVGLRPRSSS
jgi:glycosyltransferase involved in cell wall biosynthesis